jgi:hypothetical protein
LRDARPDLPDSFVRVVERATAEQQEERYQTAGELEAALTRVISSPVREPIPIPVPRPDPWDWKKLVLYATSIVLVVAVALTVPRILRSSRPTDSRTAVVRPDPAVVSTTPPSAAGTAATYRIETAFYREGKGVVQRLKPWGQTRSWRRVVIADPGIDSDVLLRCQRRRARRFIPAVSVARARRCRIPCRRGSAIVYRLQQTET